MRRATNRIAILEAEIERLSADNARLVAERDAMRTRDDDGLIPLKCAMANPGSKAEHDRVRRAIKRGDVRHCKVGNRLFVNSDDVQLVERAYRQLRRSES